MHTLTENLLYDGPNDRPKTRGKFFAGIVAVAAAVMLFFVASETSAQLPRTITGKVYEDVDANGRRDTADRPLPDLKITVIDSITQRIVTETSTDGKGAYSVRVEDPRVFVVIVSATPPNGFTQTSPTSVTYRVDLREQQMITDFLFHQDFISTNNIPPCGSLYWFWDCRRISLTAGVQDNFNTAGQELSAPSAQLQQFLRNNNYSTTNQFDFSGQDRVFAHTFTIPRCSDGRQPRIVSARLTIRIKGNGGLEDNDAIWIINAPTPTTVWGSRLANLNGGTWNSNPTTFVWDLAAMPTGGYPSNPTNILSALQDGALDVLLQDDSGIDYMRLDVEYCCLATAPVDCIVEPRLDTNCCNYNFNLRNNSASPITKIEYQTFDGTVNFLSGSGCPYTAIASDTYSGALNFASPCGALSMPMVLSTTPDANNGTGWITLVLRVYHQNGGVAYINQRFKCRRAPLSRCDSSSWAPYSFDPNNINGRIFTVTNQKLPGSPITWIDVKFTPPLRPVDNQPLVVNGGSLKINGVPSGNAWGPTPLYSVRIPNAPQTLTPAATNQVSFWLGIDRTQLWNGTVELTIHHADGDVCEYRSSWRTTSVRAEISDNAHTFRPDLRFRELVATELVFAPRTDSGNVARVVIELEQAGNDQFFSTAGETLPAVNADGGTSRTATLQTYQTEKRMITTLHVPVNDSETTSPDSIRLPFVLAIDTSRGRTSATVTVTLYNGEGQEYGSKEIVLDSTNSTRIRRETSGIESIATGALRDGERRIEISPNPTSDVCDVTFMLEERDEIGVEVYDLDGNLVIRLDRKPLETGEQTIRLSTAALTSGTYYLKLVGSRGELGRLMTVVR